MARPVRHDPLRLLIAAATLAVIALAGLIAWERYAERYAVTEPEEGGPPVAQIVSGRISGMSRLKVAELSGIVQSTASDIRGFGWLKSDRVVKMPYSVDYFVDVGRIGPGDLEWNEENRTLIVDAPEITVGKPNTDEGRRTLVRTTGLFVTREAGEALARRTSLRAEAIAGREARSPERMAQAREHARRAVARLLQQPLAAAGYPEARVVVTFPAERSVRNSEQWDVSRPVEEVVRNGA